MKNSIDEKERLSILYKLAEILHAQRNYHLATKKFTQAGDKVNCNKSPLYLAKFAIDIKDNLELFQSVIIHPSTILHYKIEIG